MGHYPTNGQTMPNLFRIANKKLITLDYSGLCLEEFRKTKIPLFLRNGWVKKLPYFVIPVQLSFTPFADVKLNSLLNVVMRPVTPY